jgi:F-type H+-transporting ATPase subunit b
VRSFTLLAAASPSASPDAGSGKTNNFLIPNGTFIAEAVIFLIILAVIGKYVVPYVNKALAERQEAIRVQFQEGEEARARLEAAEAEYREQIASARADAARQREEAREQGAQILAELKTQAHQESDRIIKAAQQQIEAERARTVAALRAEVGTLAVELAGRVVGESLTDDARRRRVVERFLTEVESRAGGAGGGADGASDGAAAGEQVRS